MRSRARSRRKRDKPSQMLQMPFLNPQNGPIMIEGAEKGDVVAVYIESMVPRGDDPHGFCCMIPNFGALTGTDYTALLNEPLPEIVRKIKIDEENVYWSKRNHAAVQAAYRHAEPFAGDRFDQLPHARQSRRQHGCAGHGAGQHNLSAGPLAGRASVHRRCACLSGRRRSVRRGRRVSERHHRARRSHQGLAASTGRGWRTKTCIMSIGSARPLEDATRIAYRELVLWMATEYGFDKWDAYMMLSQCGRVGSATSSIRSTPSARRSARSIWRRTEEPRPDCTHDGKSAGECGGTLRRKPRLDGWRELTWT